MLQVAPSNPAAYFGGGCEHPAYAPAAALSAQVLCAKTQLTNGCTIAFPASDLPSLETILQLYVLSMSSEHLLATGTVDWDFQPKSKTAEEFLARTVSSDLSSYSSATLSIDSSASVSITSSATLYVNSEEAKDDLPERSCSFWDDVGAQTFGLAQELSRSASTSSEAASIASSDDSDEENDDTSVLLPWDL